MASKKSDFGRGLVICLVKFAEHYERYQRDKDIYASMRAGGNSIFPESGAVESFFNGASDHLYEIKVPKAWANTEIEAKVKELQSKGLEIGHGFTGKAWTDSDFHDCYNLCREIALLIDKQIGLNPDMGSW